MALGTEWEGIGVIRATYPVASNVRIPYDRTVDGNSSAKGLCVHVSANGVVDTVAAGERIHGVIERVEEDPSGTNVATVAIRGIVTVKAGDNGLTVGKSIMGDTLSSAEGYATDVDPTTLSEVAQQRGTVIDATTSTAVLVLLH